MHLKTLLTALLALALLAPAGASAYTPRHGKPCHHGYVKRFKVVKRDKHRHRVRICVKRKRAASLAPAPTVTKTKLHAHLDPSYTRNPLDPFAVTYAYSASATQQQVPVAGASVSTSEEPAPLPSGVLALYSDGKLECAVNVGGSATGSECPVSYGALGEHSVTTIYSSGEQSATETEIEHIEPLPTATTLSVSYADLPSGPVPIKQYAYCTGSEHLDSEDCEYTYEWELGTLTEDASSDPAGAVDVACTIASCPSGLTGLVDGAGSAPIILKAWGDVTGHYHQVPNSPTCEQVKAAATSGSSSLDQWTYPTEVGLKATPRATGYVQSQATAAEAFVPTLPC